MVMAGMGFAFMPEYSVTHGGLLRRPLSSRRSRRTVALVNVAGRPLSPAGQIFAARRPSPPLDRIGQVKRRLPCSSHPSARKRECWTYVHLTAPATVPISKMTETIMNAVASRLLP
jgi:DNA-binding transcriptional LysR family regulator